MTMVFDGIRVLDIGTMVAGPFTAALMGDFGAEVIKIELPGTGDPVRQLLPTKNGVPLWWKVLSRNKKSVTIDLHREEGQELFVELAARSDVVVESFRPGTLERWAIGWERLHAANPELVMLRVSGFGQSGPLRRRPGFGRYAEAFSGLANLTGFRDGPPMHSGLPLADYITGMMGWGAVASALYHRAVDRSGPRGQYIDMALYESVFRILEFMMIEHDQLGLVRTRMGNHNAYVAPVNTYQLKDGTWITFTASTQSIVDRLFAVMEQPELSEDPRFKTNSARVEHREELDAFIADWFATRTAEEVERRFDDTGIPFAPIMDSGKLAENPHIAERDAVIEVEDPELGPVRMQSVFPWFSATPGSVRWAGPALGQHTAEILAQHLGLSQERQDELARLGVIGRGPGGGSS